MITSKFISRKEEITAIVPIAESIETRSFLSYLFSTEEKVIRPLLGPGLMAGLASVYENYRAAGYDETVFSIPEKELLIRVQMAIVNLALHKWVVFNYASISGKGVTVANGDSKGAPAWVMEYIRNGSQTDGHEAVESMLRWLDDHREDYPLWNVDDNFNHYINTASDFNQYFEIGESRYTFLRIAPQRKNAEKTVDALIRELGPELKEQQKTKELSPANARLLDLVKSAVANLAMADALLFFSFEFSDYGITLMSNSNTENIRVKSPVNETRLQMIRDEARQKGLAALDEAKNLILHHIDDYPTFRDGAFYSPAPTAPGPFVNPEHSKIVFL